MAREAITLNVMVGLNVNAALIPTFADGMFWTSPAQVWFHPTNYKERSNSEENVFYFCTCSIIHVAQWPLSSVEILSTTQCRNQDKMKARGIISVMLNAFSECHLATGFMIHTRVYPNHVKLDLQDRIIISQKLHELSWSFDHVGLADRAWLVCRLVYRQQHSS